MAASSQFFPQLRGRRVPILPRTLPGFGSTIRKPLVTLLAHIKGRDVRYISILSPWNGALCVHPTLIERSLKEEDLGTATGPTRNARIAGAIHEERGSGVVPYRAHRT